MTRVLALFTMVWTVGLSGACAGDGRPVAVDTKNDTCSFCRMAVSDARLAAQIVVAGEEPRFFDDIGCLAGYLQANQADGRRTVFVADHRTGEWVAADRAVFARLPRTSTPMGSGLIAHATIESRNEDASATGSSIVSRDVALGVASVDAGR